MIAVILKVPALAQEKLGETSPGLEPYIPTKLEWLALELKADNQYDEFIDNRFGLTYIAKGEDTILISVIHFPDVDRSAMWLAVDYAKKITQTVMDRHKWYWVRIEVEYNILN